MSDEEEYVYPSDESSDEGGGAEDCGGDGGGRGGGGGDGWSMPPPGAPSLKRQPSYEVTGTAAILKMREEMVANLMELTGGSENDAIALLLKCKWDAAWAEDIFFRHVTDDAAAAADTATTAAGETPACFVCNDGENLRDVGCGHSMCLDCWCGQLQSVLKSEAAAVPKLTCFYGTGTVKCPRFIPDALFREVIGLLPSSNHLLDMCEAASAESIRINILVRAHMCVHLLLSRHEYEPTGFLALTHCSWHGRSHQVRKKIGGGFYSGEPFADRLPRAGLWQGRPIPQGQLAGRALRLRPRLLLRVRPGQPRPAQLHQSGGVAQERGGRGRDGQVPQGQHQAVPEVQFTR